MKFSKSASKYQNVLIKLNCNELTLDFDERYFNIGEYKVKLNIDINITRYQYYPIRWKGGFHYGKTTNYQKSCKKRDLVWKLFGYGHLICQMEFHWLGYHTWFV